MRMMIAVDIPAPGTACLTCGAAMSRHVAVTDGRIIAWCAVPCGHPLAADTPFRLTEAEVALALLMDISSIYEVMRAIVESVKGTPQDE